MNTTIHIYYISYVVVYYYIKKINGYRLMVDQSSSKRFVSIRFRLAVIAVQIALQELIVNW